MFCGLEMRVAVRIEGPPGTATEYSYPHLEDRLRPWLGYYSFDELGSAYVPEPVFRMRTDGRKISGDISSPRPPSWRGCSQGAVGELGKDSPAPCEQPRLCNTGWRERAYPGLLRDERHAPRRRCEDLRSLLHPLRCSQRASGRVQRPVPCPEGATGDSPGWNPGNHTPQRPPCPERAHGTGDVRSPFAPLGRGVMAWDDPRFRSAPPWAVAVRRVAARAGAGGMPGGPWRGA